MARVLVVVQLYRYNSKDSKASQGVFCGIER